MNLSWENTVSVAMALVPVVYGLLLYGAHQSGGLASIKTMDHLTLGILFVGFPVARFITLIVGNEAIDRIAILDAALGLLNLVPFQQSNLVLLE
jgi:hypothetical protein